MSKYTESMREAITDLRKKLDGITRLTVDKFEDDNVKMINMRVVDTLCELDDLEDGGYGAPPPPDSDVITNEKIREKLDQLMRRPTGLNDQLADIYRGRIEGLRWVLGDLEEL